MGVVDAVAIVILMLFVVAGIRGVFRWIWGAMLGLIAGVVFIGLVGTWALSGPLPGSVRSQIAESRIVSTITAQLQDAVQDLQPGTHVFGQTAEGPATSKR
jgi:hypothetical protein